jgi:2-(acetamidomethylene)succinate hydrolase
MFQQACEMGATTIPLKLRLKPRWVMIFSVLAHALQNRIRYSEGYPMFSTSSAAAADSAIREYTIETPQIVQNVREIGDGPLTIFLHGITAVGAVWDPVLMHVKGSLRAIGVDQRGHGYSGKPDNGYSADDYSNDLIALIEKLNCGPAVVVGHSLGARNAVVAAVKRPNMVRAVVAVDFTPYIEDEVFESLEARVNGGDRPFSSIEEIEIYLQNRYVNLPPDAVSRRAAHGYRRNGDQFRPLADPAAMAATAKGLREELVTAFTSVKTPVLLVRGAGSKLVSPAAWDRTKQLRPDMPAIEIENTDHYVPEEAPDAIAAAVLDFALRR